MILVTVLAAVEDTFDLIFDFVIDLNWGRWGKIRSVNVVAYPGREAVDVEDRVLMH